MAFGKLKIAIASILTLALVSGCASAVSPKSPTDATPDAIPTNRNHFEAVQTESTANKPAVAQVSRDIKVGFLFVGLPGDYGFTYAQNQGRLLALNAAVEAARAGTHGKGFAVVSDEVRNLAAKSAEAAKDSEALITDSINRAELGTQIANETAAALSGIVLGVKESNRIISDIAKFAEEQGVSIAGINTDIEQIGKIVRQNSEAAQASASSSQEMSTQAESLQEMTARFKLK